MYLHSNSTQILALKKTGFFTFSDSKKNFQKKNYKIIMQLFSADAIMFLKKFKKIFFTPKKWKNGPQKLLIIGPDPFISQSSPDQRPTAQNWFFILWNLGTRHLFSYLCSCCEQSAKTGCWKEAEGLWIIFDNQSRFTMRVSIQIIDSNLLIVF